VLAHISRDPTLVSFFGEGVDVLKMVASHWMGTVCFFFIFFIFIFIFICMFILLQERV
jgi:hypothetical protein